MFVPAAKGIFLVTRNRWPKPTFIAVGIVAWLLIANLIVQQASAQGTMAPGTGMLGGREPDNTYPAQSYYLGLAAYRDGDFATAVNLFDDAARSGRRTVAGRWIDSIPPLVMKAECFYEMGDCVGAAELNDEVMSIVLRDGTFIQRLDWNSISAQRVIQSKPSWLWPAAASINVMPVPGKMQYLSGAPLTAQRLAQGGVIEEPNIRQIDGIEIMRTLAVAGYRRRILLGPLTQGDRTMDPIVNATSVVVADPASNAIVRSTQCAIRYGAGQQDEVRNLVSSGIVGGAFHPVAPAAMMAGLHSFASQDSVSDKVANAIQTAHVAAAMEQPEWIGPALMLAAGYCDRQTAGQVGATASEIAIAIERKSSIASMQAMAAAADAWVTAGNLETAEKSLTLVANAVSRPRVSCRRTQAYVSYVAMRLAAAKQPATVPSESQFNASLDQVKAFAFQSKTKRTSLVSCPRIFQRQRLLPMIGQGFGASGAGEIISSYVGDSPTWLWRTDPVDALASTLHERWPLHLARLQITAKSQNGTEILKTIDDAFSDRFMTDAPLGGRAHQIRTMAWSEDESLPAEARKFRETHPAMKALRAAVIASGADPASAPGFESATISLALSRMAMPRAVLPRLDPKRPLAELPPKTAVLSFADAGSAMVATLVVDGKISQWPIPEAAALKSSINRYLQMIGVGKARGLRLPQDEEALTKCEDLLVEIRSLLFPDATMLTYLPIERLWIIPDGPLWYFPFEAIHANDEGDRIGDKLEIVYAPTPGSVLYPAGPAATKPNVAVAADLFFSPRDTEINETRVQEILGLLAAPVRLDPTAKLLSGRIGTEAGHLLIASARVCPPNDPLSLIPSPTDPSGPQGTLASWSVFPHSPPSTVSLFGLRTAVDQGQFGNGSEIFKMLCSLRAAGVRSVMLSRWAVGGESTAGLIAEYVQELPMVGMSDAWSRSRDVLRRSDLDPVAEPLLTKTEHTREDLNGDQPLFWAGYLISTPD
jgi:CHAT domain